MVGGMQPSPPINKPSPIYRSCLENRILTQDQVGREFQIGGVPPVFRGFKFRVQRRNWDKNLFETAYNHAWSVATKNQRIIHAEILECQGFGGQLMIASVQVMIRGILNYFKVVTALT